LGELEEAGGVNTLEKKRLEGHWRRLFELELPLKSGNLVLTALVVLMLFRWWRLVYLPSSRAKALGWTMWRRGRSTYLGGHGPLTVEEMIYF